MIVSIRWQSIVNELHNWEKTIGENVVDAMIFNLQDLVMAHKGSEKGRMMTISMALENLKNLMDVLDDEFPNISMVRESLRLAISILADTKTLKWEPREQRYKPYAVPPSWHVSCYESNLETIVNCARCGRKIRYGDGYTSRQIHTGTGFGYAVCERCYEEEWSEEECLRSEE